MDSKPFADFCKVYASDLGQIAVLKENEDAPQIRVSVHPDRDGFGICSVNLTFPSTDEGVEARDAAYRQMTEEHAFFLARELYHQLPELEEEEK